MFLILIFAILGITGIVSLYFYLVKLSTTVNGGIDLADKHVLITGGSSGIGRALAFDMVRRGARVTIVARNKITLEETVNEIRDRCKNLTPKVDYEVLDVTSPMETIDTEIKRITKKHGAVDILVNCAGIAIGREIGDTSVEQYRMLYDVNVLGSIKTTKSVLESMIRKKFGQVVFISSVAGQFGFYGYTAYSTTKFALTGFAQALNMECRAHNIGVTVIYPPDTDTNGYNSENIGKPLITKKICETAGLESSEYVANRIGDSIQARKYELTFGLDGFLIGLLNIGCQPVSSVSSELAHFFIAGVSRIVFLFYLKMYYSMANKKND